jgi:hypothetical protein
MRFDFINFILLLTFYKTNNQMDTDDIKATSMSSFFELFYKKRAKISHANSVWFRGENNSFESALIPKAFRKLAGNNDEIFRQASGEENNLKLAFRREAATHLLKAGIVSSPWTDLFLMQHYGIRTRLLDWTESALVALFFATENYFGEEDGKVWILSPHELSMYSTGGACGLSSDFILAPYEAQYANEPLVQEGIISAKALAHRYLTSYFNKIGERETGVYYPIPLLPTLFDDRMSQQKSCFTLFGNQVDGLKAPKKDNFLQCITIDGKSKFRLRNELRLLGFSNKSVYPDLEGVCRDINENQ